MDPIELDVRVGPSLHPGILETSDENVQKGLANAYTVLIGFHETETRINKDPALSAFGKSQAIDSKREAAFKDASRELDRAEQILVGDVERHQAAVAHATKPEKTTVDPKEIRSFVAGLPDESKRSMFVLERAAAGDRETVAAVFSDVPLYLIGLEHHKPGELAELKAEAERRLSAGAYEKLEAARTRVARLHSMRRVLNAKYGRPGSVG